MVKKDLIKSIMTSFRNDVDKIGNLKVKELIDYSKGVDNLPKSNVLKFILEDDSYVIVRPSGTEPKLKTYLSVSKADEKAAKKCEDEIYNSLSKILSK